MDQTHFSDQRAAQELIGLFKSSRLIPFFGSGFTRGAKAKKGKSPDAAELTKKITELAASKIDLPEDEKKQIMGIANLKSAFSLLGMEDYIPKKSAQTFLTNIFSGIDLPNDFRKKLLSLDWPHVFSFNVDDAIERANKSLEVLRPNKKTSREYIAANRCLFKIHGDISEYASTEDTNLIFTWRDYAHSIASNKAMLNFLADEAKNSSFLFIGCSLDAELDILHLSKETPLSKSIYIKKGAATLEERIILSDYGINRVIYFDNYDQIYEWIFNTLRGERRLSMIREITFNEDVLERNEATLLLSNGGPIYTMAGQKRIARASSTFATRTAIDKARMKIRSNECLLISGRRFSGKTLFLFQIMLSLQEYSAKFFSSSDSYNPIIKRQIETLENHLFVFDANYLDSEALDEVLGAKMLPSSRIILCASLGDVERIRPKLSDRGVGFEEIGISNILDKSESLYFNDRLAKAGLPVINSGEYLIDYAFRCHEEYKAIIPKSTLFKHGFKRETYSLLTLLAAFGKAKQSHIDCLFDNFDIDGFVKANDRVFEIETSATGERVLICGASAWLIKIMQDFVKNTKDAYEVVSNLIKSLEGNGFSSIARELVRIDKINEISGGYKSRVFIKKIYENIADVYFSDSHYWLQRAKADLISSNTLREVEDGIGHARKVRLDNSRQKNQTYYSATLVLAQLYAKAYKISYREEFLKNFISPCVESIENYQNNERHINELDRVDDFSKVIRILRDNPPKILLPEIGDLRMIVSFFESRSGKRKRRKPTAKNL